VQEIVNSHKIDLRSVKFMGTRS